MDTTTLIRPKLLLADDSVTIRKVVELTFAEEGVDVTAAADATSAMESFIQTQPDIVLVDVSLPGISGYQICEMIKQDDATRHIPVLLLVGSYEPFDQSEAERVGADGFLTKPFQSIRELVARVSELLSTDKVSEQVPNELSSEQSLNDEASEPNVSSDLEVQGSDTLASELEVDKETPQDEWTAEPDEISSRPEIADIDDLYRSSFATTSEIEKFNTVEDLLGDAGLDDELIQTSYDTERSDPTRPPETSEPSDPPPAIKEFDWSAEAKIEPAQGRSGRVLESFPHGDLLDLEGDHDEPQKGVYPGGAESEIMEASERTWEPSSEQIARIAEKVVERLSDRVVRDIAREAVPRIAEKLIREALAEEK